MQGNNQCKWSRVPKHSWQCSSQWHDIIRGQVAGRLTLEKVGSAAASHCGVTAAGATMCATIKPEENANFQLTCIVMDNSLFS